MKCVRCRKQRCESDGENSVNVSKKRILIINNNMHIGGVQKALLNLLKCVHADYQITLALFHPQGELLKEIPADVQVLPLRSAYRYLGATKYDADKSVLLKIGRTFYGAICRFFGRDAAVSLMAIGQKKLSGYDVAISFLHNAGDKAFYGGCNDFVLRHADAPLRCTFLHCDYMHCGADTEKNGRQYARFDRIAACSAGCRDAFLEAHSELADRTMVVRNCQDYRAIRSNAVDAPAALAERCINVVTVARLGREKGVPRAIEALAQLGDLGTPYHYYVVGDGVERPEVERLIRKYGLEHKVTLVGELANPYGYMKAADLLLLPSISEAAPMVIAEAACLGTPILSTRTTSAKDMVEDAGCGWVCDNSIEGICEALRQLMGDSELLKTKAASLADKTFNNDLAIEQFRLLVGDVRTEEQPDVRE